MKNLFRTAQDPVSCATHTLGAIGALVGGFVFLFRSMSGGGSTMALATAMCFCLSMVALYSASAVYHFYPGDANSSGVKRVLRKLDHSMIYVLIAGTYTPFSLMLLPAPKGLRFCLILWAVALVGVAIKLLWLDAPRILSTTLYLLMGWAILPVIGDFAAAAPNCLLLIALGGVCYSVGAVFYIIKKPNISPAWTFHELFHLLILGGSLCHYLAVYFYVL